MAKGFRFHYLYRDSGNYKTFGHKDFLNPSNLTLEEATQQIRNGLISTEFFDPEQVGIRKFRFHRYLDDSSWYEFEHLDEIDTGHPLPSIEELMKSLKMNCFRKGNDVFERFV